jgi:AcrR family transcriptional regulator
VTQYSGREMLGEAMRTLVARSGMRPKFKSAPAGARNRGRPKNECIDVEVVAAVLEGLRSRGYRGVTIEGVARQVKRARTSLYRRWPSKRHLVADAVVSELGAQPASDTGSLRKDLKAAVRTLLTAFAGPLGKALPGLVADMALDPVLARMIQEKVLMVRRRSIRAALERGMARGESDHGLDIELLIDMLTGPFYFRALFGHLPATPAMVNTIVDYVMSIVCPRAVGAMSLPQQISD